MILDALRGRLIVSCQPVPGGPLDQPATVAAHARAALAEGAAGLRIEGVANLRAVRGVTDAPVIGLIKRDLEGSGVRITPWEEDVDALVEAGADIVAYDATDRARPAPAAALAARIRARGRLPMADCATEAEARAALAHGAAIVGTTLSGYTGGPVPDAPDLALVAALARLGGFTVAEGRYHRPDQAAAALRHGAEAVVVGSAITRPEHVTSWFVAAVARARDAREREVLALDIGGTKILAARVRDGAVLDSETAATDPLAGPDTWLDTAARIAAPFAKGCTLVAAAATGRLDGGLWHAENPRTLAIPPATPLPALLARRFGRPALAVNDAQAAAWGEARLGAGKGVESLAFLTISTGIGGGLVLGGRLVTGRAGYAGHFGTMRMGRAEPVEDQLAGRFLAAEAARHGAPPNAEAVFAAAAAGEGWADAALTRSAGGVAALLVDLQRAVAPERVVIGGGIGLAPGYLDRLTAALAEVPQALRPALVPALLGRDAGVVGVADLALEPAASGLPDPTRPIQQEETT